MAVANIGSKWVNGNLVFFERSSGEVILELSAADIAVKVGNGASGTFEDVAGKTITVTNGIVTEIAEPEGGQ